MPSKLRNNLDAVGHKCLALDQFGTEFKFRLPDGRTKHKTYIGVIMTLILLITMTTFVIYRLIDMR